MNMRCTCQPKPTGSLRAREQPSEARRGSREGPASDVRWQLAKRAASSARPHFAPPPRAPARATIQYSDIICLADPILVSRICRHPSAVPEDQVGVVSGTFLPKISALPHPLNRLSDRQRTMKN